MLLKTSTDKLEALEKRLRELHSYRVPEFLVVPVEHGSAGYMEWMLGTLAVRNNSDQTPSALNHSRLRATASRHLTSLHLVF